MGDGSVDETRVDELGRMTDGWLDQDLAGRTGEWAYSQAERCLFVEERIGAGGGNRPPTNIKACVYNQEILRWVVNQWEAEGDGFGVSYYSPGWQKLDVGISGLPGCDYMRCPDSLERMSSAAKAIAGDLDFLRVDLYEVGGEIWFGETSPYPNSGLVRYHPREFDLEWGSPWKLPDL